MTLVKNKLCSTKPNERLSELELLSVDLLTIKIYHLCMLAKIYIIDTVFKKRKVPVQLAAVNVLE